MAKDKKNSLSQQSGSQKKQKRRPEVPEPVKGESFVPDNYVEHAEEVMRKLLKYNPDRKWRPVTTTKIRNLFSLVVDICEEEEQRKESTLRDESIARLKRMYVRAVYEFGRDPATREFIEMSGLLEYLKNIQADRDKFIRFTRYMEALVAFHRYLGGREA